MATTDYIVLLHGEAHLSHVPCPPSDHEEGRSDGTTTRPRRSPPSADRPGPVRRMRWQGAGLSQQQQRYQPGRARPRGGSRHRPGPRSATCLSTTRGRTLFFVAPTGADTRPAQDHARTYRPPCPADAKRGATEAVTATLAASNGVTVQPAHRERLPRVYLRRRPCEGPGERAGHGPLRRPVVGGLTLRGTGDEDSSLFRRYLGRRGRRLLNSELALRLEVEALGDQPHRQHHLLQGDGGVESGAE